MRRMLAAAVATLVLSGCVSTSVMPLTENTARVLVECSMCSVTDLQQHGFNHAAATTIHCDFDEFVIESIELLPDQATTRRCRTRHSRSRCIRKGAAPTDGSSFDARAIVTEEQAKRYHKVVAPC